MKLPLLPIDFPRFTIRRFRDQQTFRRLPIGSSRVKAAGHAEAWTPNITVTFLLVLVLVLGFPNRFEDESVLLSRKVLFSCANF